MKKPPKGGFFGFRGGGGGINGEKNVVHLVRIFQRPSLDGLTLVFCGLFFNLKPIIVIYGVLLGVFFCVFFSFYFVFYEIKIIDNHMFC